MIMSEAELLIGRRTLERFEYLNINIINIYYNIYKYILYYVFLIENILHASDLCILMLKLFYSELRIIKLHFKI